MILSFPSVYKTVKICQERLTQVDLTIRVQGLIINSLFTLVVLFLQAFQARLASNLMHLPVCLKHLYINALIVKHTFTFITFYFQHFSVIHLILALYYQIFLFLSPNLDYLIYIHQSTSTILLEAKHFTTSVI